MTEGFNHIASDQELETAAIAGAAAVERLITERNNFRTELAASKAAQEELRRRFGLLHRYIELSRKVVCELHQFDSLMRDDIGERAEVTTTKRKARGPTGNLITLDCRNHRAHRRTVTEPPRPGVRLPLEA
jgi:hypothetical protein